MAKIPILFNHYGDEWIRGSEILLLDLLSGLDKSRFTPIVWCNGRQMADACLAAGYCTYQSEFRTMLDYNSDPANVKEYFKMIGFGIKLCREHHIRLIHANSAAPAQWLVPISRHMHLPMLAHLHSSYLRRSRYSNLLHCANMVVGVSKHVLEGLRSDGLADRRLRVIYNGINFSRFSDISPGVRERNRIPNDAIVVTTAGALVVPKGHDILLRAFSAATDQSSRTHLVIMGDGPERRALRQLAGVLGIEKRVHFLGQVQDVSSVYAESDIFALATRKESFGLVLAEAGYLGLPTVSTKVGGIPEVVENNSTGLLVDADDVSAFSQALAGLIKDRSLRQRLGKAARARVEAEFSLSKMVSQLEALYCELTMTPFGALGWFDLTRQIYGPMINLVFPRARAHQ